jgi:hypothetical protein
MIRSAPRMHVLLPLSQLSQLELPTTVATVDVVVRHQVMSSCLCLFPFFDIFQFRLNLHSILHHGVESRLSNAWQPLCCSVGWAALPM